MNYMKICSVCCIILLIGLAGCGKTSPAEHIQEDGQEQTELTEMPDETGSPEEIKLQEVKPQETESQEEAKPQETEQQKDVDLQGGEEVPEEQEIIEYTYPFYEWRMVANTEQAYELTKTGGCRIVFKGQYSQLVFALPEGINMALCDRVTVKAKSEYGHLAVKLYDKTIYSDPWGPEVFIRYNCKREGMHDYNLVPELTCDVWGIGLMATEQVEDFSKYEVEVESVTFYMKSGYED